MILVVGDVMLDEYIRGKATRIAPEAPVPVVLLDGEPEMRLGGAANVAASVAALGEDVALVGPYWHDKSDDIQRLCNEHGIELVGGPNDYGASWSRTTTVKTRVVDENGRLLIRMDSETVEPWKSARILEDALRSKKPDTVVFADYAKGCWTPANWSTILDYFNTCDEPEGPRRLLVDAKRKLDMYEGAGVIKCNESEWERFGGTGLCPRAVAIVTKGKAGLSYSRIPVGRIAGSWIREWTDVAGMPHEVHDVTGAGDVVGAVVAVGLSRGMSMSRMLESAVRAGGMSVTQPMTGVANPKHAGLEDA